MILVSGDLVEVGEGEVEGTKYYFARINDVIRDADGNDVAVQKVRLALEQHQVKPLSKFEGDRVAVRASLKPNGRLEYVGMAAPALAELVTA